MAVVPAQGVNVDDLDLRIIGALQVDGRRPVVEIARELDVPKSTVQRRLDALIRDRVVMIAAYADSAKLGLGIHVHLNLRLDLARYQQALDAVVALPEVRWVAVTTGPADLVAEAYFASPDHLHDFIRTRLASIAGITSVETSVILSVEKFTFHWDALRREADQHVHSHVRLSTPADSYHEPPRQVVTNGSAVPAGVDVARQEHNRRDAGVESSVLQGQGAGRDAAPTRD